jgi:hypothetical protein
MIGSYPYGLIQVSYSATPVFDCFQGNVFTMTLTGNIQSMSIINAMPGHLYTFIFTQDSLGLHTINWPTGFNGVVNIPALAAPNSVCVQSAIFDGTSFYGVAMGQVNLQNVAVAVVNPQI